MFGSSVPPLLLVSLVLYWSTGDKKAGAAYLHCLRTPETRCGSAKATEIVEAPPDGHVVDRRVYPVSSPDFGPGYVNPLWWPARSTCPTVHPAKPICP